MAEGTTVGFNPIFDKITLLSKMKTGTPKTHKREGSHAYLNLNCMGLIPSLPTLHPMLPQRLAKGISQKGYSPGYRVS